MTYTAKPRYNEAPKVHIGASLVYPVLRRYDLAKSVAILDNYPFFSFFADSISSRISNLMNIRGLLLI